MTQDIFEKGTRLKVRFDSSKGLLTMEDLCVIPLKTGVVNLNKIAQALSKEIKDSGEESFVAESTANPITQLKFDIVRHIIAVRLGENKAKQDAVVAKEKKELITSLISKKKNAALEEMSLEDLEKLL